MNLNKVFLIGRVTRDIELKSLPSGQTVANLGLATNRVYVDKNGETQRFLPEFVPFYEMIKNDYEWR